MHVCVYPFFFNPSVSVCVYINISVPTISISCQSAQQSSVRVCVVASMHVFYWLGTDLVELSVSLSVCNPISPAWNSLITTYVKPSSLPSLAGRMNRFGITWLMGGTRSERERLGLMHQPVNSITDWTWPELTVSATRLDCDVCQCSGLKTLPFFMFLT